jgi:hypothetical protein
MVIRDCPLFFHVEVGMTMQQGDNPQVFPEYRLTQQQYAQQYRLVCDFVKNSTQMLRCAPRVYDKVRAIHNSMCRHVIYYGINEDDSHNVIGAILKRKAVCESIAKAFKLICDANMIPCIVIFGRSNSTDGTEYGTVSEESNKSNHAWNMVKMGDYWYNIDITFDIGAVGIQDKSLIRYDYFCRSDQVFSVNHTPNGAFLPQALKDHSFYKSTGYYAGSKSQLRQLLRKAMAAGNDLITFEYRLGAGIDMDAVQALVREEADPTRYRSFTTTLNTEIGVVTVRLEK